MQRVIDLRSDTVTRPSRAMRDVMANAEVGDDVYGDDPTVKRLEDTVAKRLGKEAALFVPSGTMGNTLCYKVLTEPGDELLMDGLAHSLHFEVSAAAALCGVQIRALPSKKGLFAATDVTAAVKPERYYLPRTRVLVIENTHNFGGGTVWPKEELASVAKAARDAGLFVHLDGARLFNAEVASGVSVKDYASNADTVSICLSKGLGAPVGSVIAASRTRIEQARRYRKMWGGGMRQVGILAAAGLYALEHNVARLAEDHDNARHLAERLATVPALAVDAASVSTNMVFAKVVKGGAEGLAKELAKADVLVNATGEGELRFVTHLDVDAAALEEAVTRVKRVAA
jgi:threonine aldolase